MEPNTPQPLPPQNTNPVLQPTPQPAPLPPVTPAPLPARPPANKHALWIVIAVLVFLAAGGALWWWMSRNAAPTFAPENEAHQTADTATVRNVVWVEPFDIPGTYKKYDDSFEVVKTFSYDDATNDCWITTDIAPYGTYSRYGKTPKDVALDLENEEGVKIVKNEAGPVFTFKDVDGSHNYQFESIHLEKELSIKDIDYTKEHTIVAYKPFGVYAASISFTCKDETWNAQKPTLEKLMQQFTLRTER
jgi:hypothetical protein